MSSAFESVHPVKQKFSWLSFGEVKPSGWIKEQMQKDLKGFVGHLDELVPDLIIEDDIYGKNRLTRKVDVKSVGNIREGDDINVQYLWWNSETQSNWWDGFIRHAILLNDKKALHKSEKYIHRILNTQDADGYLGIYDEDLRYHFYDENGELWAKATLLRSLLAWYEFAKESKVLKAIERAVENVMIHYPVYESTPFKSIYRKAGGLTHGLVFTDILDQLYQLTKNESYLEYALFLYQNFSEEISFEDAAFKNLINPSFKLKGHGVHTYEHLRPLIVACYTNGHEDLKKALEIFSSRIEKEITPAGGPAGDEWILEREAAATNTGYEYCSLQELLDSYSLLLQKSSEANWGDKIELLFYNAAQGARNPVYSSIAYCKTDNSYEMSGTLNGAKQVARKQTRFKYSPAHQDVAVCCAPNAGRITPYFMKAMWMKDEEGLIASLLGPSEVNTFIKEIPLKILEETDYPFSNKIIFKISVTESVFFSLRIRKPAWVKKFILSSGYLVENDYLVVEKMWKGEEIISLEFFPEAETKLDLKGDYYFTYGALVFALPIPARVSVEKKYSAKNFADHYYTAVELPDLCFNNHPVRIIEESNKHPLKNMRIKTKLFNRKTNQDEEVTFVPIGQTILRQVTFKENL